MLRMGERHTRLLSGQRCSRDLLSAEFMAFNLNVINAVEIDRRPLVTERSALSPHPSLIHDPTPRLSVHMQYHI